MTGLNREDILPIGDLIIKKSIAHHYSLSMDSHQDVFIAVAENWRPFRSVASYYLWKAYHQTL